MKKEEEILAIKKIESGPAEVIDSGTVISFAGHPIKLSYRDLNLSISFEFKTKEHPESISIDGNFNENNETGMGDLKLTLYNFDDRFGAGTIKPLRIGQYENRKLYLQIRVYTLIDSLDKTLDYTIYKGEEVVDSDRT
jgi:hypothetical protein